MRGDPAKTPWRGAMPSSHASCPDRGGLRRRARRLKHKGTRANRFDRPLKADQGWGNTCVLGVGVLTLLGDDAPIASAVALLPPRGITRCSLQGRPASHQERRSSAGV